MDARAGDPVIRNRLSMPVTGRTASEGLLEWRMRSAIDRGASPGLTPREIEALRSASRSTRRTVLPVLARTAATLTAVVVFPTPPFGLKAAMISEFDAYSLEEKRIYFNHYTHIPG